MALDTLGEPKLLHKRYGQKLPSSQALFTCLVGPAAGNVADGVPSAAQQEQRNIERAHEAHALRVAAHGEVEATEARVSTALQDYRAGCKDLHHLHDDRLEHELVALIVDAIIQRHIERVVLALAIAHVPEERRLPATPKRQRRALKPHLKGLAHGPAGGLLAPEVAGAGEVLAELVEGDGHDAVGGVEGLLHAVAVVDVDVDVQHALVVLEELQDGQHDVVDVAEPRRLALLGVVQPAGPVDGDVRVAVVELHRAADRPPGVRLAELVEPVEHRAVLAHVEALQLARVVGLVLGRHGPQELHVVVGVEPAHVLVARRERLEDVQLGVHAVVHQQRVRHADAVRLHGVPLAVVVVPHLCVVEVGHAALARLGAARVRAGPQNLHPDTAAPEEAAEAAGVTESGRFTESDAELAARGLALRAGPDGLDLDALNALFAKVGFPRREKARLRLALSHTTALLWLADDAVGGRLVAFARATGDGVFNAIIWDVVVDPAYQGSGLGKAIMERLMACLLRKGILNIALYAEPTVLGFYRPLGFLSDPDGIAAMAYSRRK
eukprot:SM000042S15284  [mRNA]  locus=s42:174238:177192:+ [translate_table: standard]